MKPDPIQREYRDMMNGLAAGVDKILNGEAKPKKIAFVILMAEFGKIAGHVVRTQFREAYENGGVFLLDEVDASDPDALTASNSALSNGMAAFPDALVRKHEDFVAIAAGNTFGSGADRQYVGRNQLDAATLDRFTVFEVDYDEMLELEISGECRTFLQEKNDA